MSSEKNQVFHPIGMLSTIATIVREGFDIAEGQTEVLVKSHAKPHPFLSITDVDRIIQQADTSLEHVACAQNQLERWKQDTSLTAAQRKEVNSLLDKIFFVARALDVPRRDFERVDARGLDVGSDGIKSSFGFRGQYT